MSHDPKPVDPAPDTAPPTLRDGQPRSRATAPPAAVDYPGALWVPARHWSARPPGAAIRLVVLHSTESGPGTARAVARFFAADPSCQGSAHYVVDADTVVQCVSESRGAWGARGGDANACGIHVEMTGRALSTDWTAGPGLAVLERAAPLVADILRRHELPCRALDAERLLAGEPGMVTHATITEAYAVRGGHCDPGGVGDHRWPWEQWLALVEAA